MSNHPHPTSQPANRKGIQHRQNKIYWIAGLAAVAVVAVALAVGLASSNGGSRPASAQPVKAAGTQTGETNAMGMPVIATPGSATGGATAEGVEVTGANWDLGRVPLLVAVRPSWTLKNTGSTPVTLGEPKPQVRKGCCPGPLTLGSRSLAPGQSTTLTFELSMHPGMDGPHDLGVYVPVTASGATSYLTLGVVGDFRN